MNGATSMVGRAICATVLLLLFMPCALAAREKPPFTTSDEPYSPQLSGIVVDTSGAVIAGAIVQVRSANGAVTKTAQSDTSGSFGIGGLSEGSYRLVVSSPGFETKEIPI